MSFGQPAPVSRQPASFEFTADNLKRAKSIIGKYPDGRQQSALLPLLDLAQRQHENWLPRAAMDYVADLLDVPPIRAYEVASFYTMFNKMPVGRHLIQVCTTTPCWLCGSNEVLKAIKDKTGLGPGENSADGAFTVVEVECLGACVNAPMVQINDDYYEDLDYRRMGEILDALGRGEAPKSGSQIGRKGSQALSGPTSLLQPPPVVATPTPKKKPAAKAKAEDGQPDEASPKATGSKPDKEPEEAKARAKPASKPKATASGTDDSQPDAAEAGAEPAPNAKEAGAAEDEPPVAKDEP